MKEHIINGGHRKVAQNNHGERLRGNLNKSDLYISTELLLFMYGVLYIDNSE